MVINESFNFVTSVFVICSDRSGIRDVSSNFQFQKNKCSFSSADGNQSKNILSIQSTDSLCISLFHSIVDIQDILFSDKSACSKVVFSSVVKRKWHVLRHNSPCYISDACWQSAHELILRADKSTNCNRNVKLWADMTQSCPPIGRKDDERAGFEYKPEHIFCSAGV